MPQMPPATAGMPLAQVDTPALVIDLDAFERNLERMASFVRAEPGCACAPLQDAQVADHRRQAGGVGGGRRVLPEGVGG